MLYLLATGCAAAALVLAASPPSAALPDAITRASAPAAAAMTAQRDQALARSAAVTRAVITAPALPRRLQVYDWARAHEGGCWYAWGGTSCSPGFDCSGAVMIAWQHAGVTLPRTTYEMLADPRQLVAVPFRRARRGDLAFFGDGHVELVAYAHDGVIRWVFGALETGTRVGEQRTSAWFYPTEVDRVR
jgi:peptidoglycan DL-endopeptidase CwlO